MSKRRDNDPAVILDVDGVLADFNGSFQAIAALKFGRHHQINDAAAQSWDDWGDLTPDQVSQIWLEIKASDRFWLGLSQLVQPEVFERIQGLQYRHDVYFVTSRVGMDVKSQTEQWLRDRGIVSPSVLISSRKGPIALGLDAAWAIDDKADNAFAIKTGSPDTRTYLLDRPYNQMDLARIGSKVKRVKSVMEFLDLVEAGQ